MKPPRELSTAVNTSSKDCDARYREADEEGLEEAGVDEVEIARIPRALSFPYPESKVAAAEREEDQGEHLEAETCQHDVLARVRLRRGVGGGSHRAANCLEDQ